VNFEVHTPAGSDDVTVIAVEGEFDLASCEKLKPAADEAVAGRRPLILDLSDCSFIDSSGLRLILQIAKELGDGDGSPIPMSVVVGESGIRKLFALTAIDQSIPLFDSREQARAWLHTDPSPNGKPASLAPDAS
jgi:anti-sigma B factor antagonist